MDAAALALLPAEPAVQLDAEAAVELPRREEAAVLRHAEAVVAELPRRAEPAVQLDAEAAVLLHAKTVVAELPRHAEAAVLLHAEAALAELPRRAEAAVLLHAEAVVLAEAPVELPRRAEVSVAELPRWLGYCRQSRRCCGRQDTGAGTTASMPFTKAIGPRKSASTAAYLTATAIPARATKAAIGVAALSSITVRQVRGRRNGGMSNRSTEQCPAALPVSPW